MPTGILRVSVLVWVRGSDADPISFFRSAQFLNSPPLIYFSPSRPCRNKVSSSSVAKLCLFFIPQKPQNTVTKSPNSMTVLLLPMIIIVITAYLVFDIASFSLCVYIR